MRKSTIIATVVVVLVVALLATYAWYGSDDGGGDDGPGDSDGTAPVLDTYINTSSFFEPYIDGSHIDAFSIPYTLEPTGNVIELRPNERVTGVTDNGDGTYSFTLGTEPGAKTLTVGMQGVHNRTSSVSGSTIVLTFDAAGSVALTMGADVYDDSADGSAPSGPTLTGVVVDGEGWSMRLNGQSVWDYRLPATLKETGNVLEIVPDRYVTDVYGLDTPGASYLFHVEYDRNSYDLHISLSGAEITSQTRDPFAKTVTVVFDCDSGVNILLKTDLDRHYE